MKRLAILFSFFRFSAVWGVKSDVVSVVLPRAVCLKGKLEGDVCVIRRPPVRLCDEGFEMRKRYNSNLTECTRVVSKEPNGSCEDGYEICHSGLGCCKHSPGPIISGCFGGSVRLENGNCVELLPLEGSLRCPPDFLAADGQCQHVKEYDCSPSKPVLTRGPPVLRPKKRTHQTFVVSQTCRDVITVAGEFVCSEYADTDKKNVCFTEVISPPQERCFVEGKTIDNCYVTDVVPIKRSCPGDGFELVCTQGRTKKAEFVTACQCEKLILSRPSLSCTRGELTEAVGKPECTVRSPPLKKCPLYFHLDELDGLCYRRPPEDSINGEESISSPTE